MYSMYICIIGIHTCTAHVHEPFIMCEFGERNYVYIYIYVYMYVCMYASCLCDTGCYIG